MLQKDALLDFYLFRRRPAKRLVRTRRVPPRIMLPQVRMRLSPPHKIQGKDLCFFGWCPRGGASSYHRCTYVTKDRARTAGYVLLPLTWP